MSDLFIILTAEIAAAVRGPTGPGAALVPLRLADGVTYVLPEAVLGDFDHESRHGALQALPIRPVDAGEWRPGDPDGQ